MRHRVKAAVSKVMKVTVNKLFCQPIVVQIKQISLKLFTIWTTVKIAQVPYLHSRSRNIPQAPDSLRTYPITVCIHIITFLFIPAAALISTPHKYPEQSVTSPAGR